jgi:hypothetical protein
MLILILILNYILCKQLLLNQRFVIHYCRYLIVYYYDSIFSSQIFSSLIFNPAGNLKRGTRGQKRLRVGGEQPSVLKNTQNRPFNKTYRFVYFFQLFSEWAVYFKIHTLDSFDIFASLKSV